MHRAVFASVMMGIVATSGAGGQQTNAADPEIVFDPPKTVVVRQTNGRPARGELLRLNEDALWLRVLDGTEVKLKLDKVRSVKTSDESFEFWPAQEDFSGLAQRIGTVSGAKLNGKVARRASAVSNRKSPGGKSTDIGQIDQDDPDERRHLRRKQRMQMENPATVGNRRPILNLPPAKNLANAATVDEPARTEEHAQISRSDDESNEPEETADDSDATGAGSIEVLVCSNCEKDLPAGFKSGSQCPHCGKVAVFEQVAVGNPFAVQGGGGQASQNPFAASGGTLPAPAATVPLVQPVAAAPTNAPAMSLEGMPLIAKVGIFAGFVVLGWFILQRR